MNRNLLRALSIGLLLVAIGFAQRKPEVRISPVRVKPPEPVLLTGTGFTPNGSALSHLLRPNGSEYNPLRFRINDKGEFVHKIDTVMLDHGTFEVWAEDEASQALSNRMQFTVESDER
jgi:hypothetical protein